MRQITQLKYLVIQIQIYKENAYKQNNKNLQKCCKDTNN